MKHHLPDPRARAEAIMGYLSRLHLDPSSASQIFALNELYEAAEQAGYLRGLRSAVGSIEHEELASIVEELNRDPRDLEPALAAPVLD